MAAAHAIGVCRTDVDQVAEFFELVDGRGGEAIFDEDGAAFGDGSGEAGVLNIYLELTPTVWYFFSYSNGVMQAISSNKAFNEALTVIKDANRSLKAENGQPEYQFIVSTNEKRNTFLRKMRSIN